MNFYSAQNYRKKLKLFFSIFSDFRADLWFSIPTFRDLFFGDITPTPSLQRCAQNLQSPPPNTRSYRQLHVLHAAAFEREITPKKSSKFEAKMSSAFFEHNCRCFSSQTWTERGCEGVTDQKGAALWPNSTSLQVQFRFEPKSAQARFPNTNSEIEKSFLTRE